MGKLCKCCRSWEPVKNKGNWAGRRNQGDCSCNSFIEFISSDIKTPRDSLVYYDYEGYSAGFTTGSEFGCIHWREKT